MNRFEVQLTIEVQGENTVIAAEYARAAGMSLQGKPGILKGRMSEPRPLFDSEPFAQIDGQLGMDS